MPRRATPASDDLPTAGLPEAGTPAVTGRYEDAVAELEGIVAHLEAGRMPLDELLAAYQRGAALLTHCQGLLAQVDDQIRVLDDSGIARRWSAAGDPATPASGDASAGNGGRPSGRQP